MDIGKIMNSHISPDFNYASIGNRFPGTYFKDIDDDNLVPSNDAIYKKLKDNGDIFELEAMKYVILHKDPIWQETTDYYFRATIDEYYDYLTYTYDAALVQFRKYIKIAICKRMVFDQIYY